MKVALLLCFLLVSAVPLARCEGEEDIAEDEDWKGEDKKHPPMEDEDMLTDDEFDEAVLMQDTRKSLKGLSPEEAEEEVREIVSIIDRDGDGLVDKEELKAYIIRVQQHNDNQQTGRVFAKADRNKDGTITLEEFWKYSEGGSVEVPDEASMDEFQRGLLQRFKTADQNNDQNLNQKEFGIFVHPHHSDAMIQHVVRDQIIAYDKNKDGFISRKEYIESYVSEDTHESEWPSWLEDEKANFDHVLDKNQDGKLDDSEVRDWFMPDMDTTNEVEARHLFMSADSNRDGKLSAEEIVSRFDTFLDSSITNNGYAVHEEL